MQARSSTSIHPQESSLAAIFIIEYLLRLWSCSIKGTYKGMRGITKFMIKPHMLLGNYLIISALMPFAFRFQFNLKNYKTWPGLFSREMKPWLIALLFCVETTFAPQIMPFIIDWFFETLFCCPSSHTRIEYLGKRFS